MPINQPAIDPRFDEQTFGFLTLGVGSFFSTSFYHTALTLIAGSRYVQIDLPSPFCKILAEAGARVGLNLTPRHIDDYICTHVHGDHSNGCEDVGLYKYFIQRARPNLYVLPEVAGPLWDQKLAASMRLLTDDDCNPYPEPTLETFFRVHTVAPDRPVVFGDVTMRIRRTRHAVPCFAMKFERGGKTLGYSCDTVFDPELIDWLSESDLIFHETTPAGPHTPYERLKELSPELKRKMVLIHMAEPMEVDDPWLRPAVQGAFYPLA